jgi:hypothetical protein
MKSLTDIKWYFPSQTIVQKGLGFCVDEIVSQIEKSDAIQYSGHVDSEGLKEGLLSYLGHGMREKYSPFSENKKGHIEQQINDVILRCNEVLPIPTKNYIFIFPYFPSESDSVFNGVMGVARYSCVFHVFLAHDFKQKDLARTVAHELNHTIYYYVNFDSFGKYTLLDQMIIEGLAEHFAEDVLNVGPAPWSVSLTESEAHDVFSKCTSMLSSKSDIVHRKVLFGGDEYPKWSGYSIGYRIVAAFRKHNPVVEWQDLMRLNSKEMLLKSNFA